jgi:hypothetical protein
MSRTLSMIEETQLEQLIDATSLVNVLNSIADTCSQKAEHIRTSYSDEGLAQLWDKRAKQVGLLADSIRAPHL